MRPLLTYKEINYGKHNPIMTCLQLPRGKGKMLSFRPKNIAANFIPKKFGYQPKNIFSSPVPEVIGLNSSLRLNSEILIKYQIISKITFLVYLLLSTYYICPNLRQCCWQLHSFFFKKIFYKKGSLIFSKSKRNT